MMTQKEIEQHASEYNHKRFKANGMMDTKMSYEIFMAFVAGANCANCGNLEITDDFAWCVYQFLQDYKGGGFGFVSTQDALDKHFARYWEKYKAKEEYDAFVETPSNRIK